MKTRSIVVLMAVLASGTPFAAGVEEPAAMAEGPVEVTIWTTTIGVGATGKAEERWSDTKIGALMAEESGIDWVFSYTESGDVETAFNLRLASGDWPEVIRSSQRNFVWLQRLLEAGVVIPLDGYYGNADYPNIAKLSPEVVDFWRYTDGNIYHFPGSVFEDPKQPWGYWAAAVWAVHPDYLAAVDMTTADLATIDGIERYLRAVQAAGLMTEDGLPVLPITGGQNLSMWQVMLNTFGVSTAGMGFDDYDGEFIHYRDHPQTKAALQWVNTLYRDGLLDPEALSQKNETLREKMMGRRVAAIGDWAWGFWQTVTAGVTPATEMVLIDYPQAPGASRPGVNITYNPYGSNGLLITTNAKNPDAVARFADYAYETGVNRDWELIQGPRGVTWDYDPDEGAPYMTFLDAELREALFAGDYNKIKTLGFGSNPLGMQSEDMNYFRPRELRETLNWIFDMHRFYYDEPNVSIARPYDSLKMPAEGLWQQNAEILGRLDVEFFAKLIGADSPAEFESTWSTYQDQLQLQGSWAQVKEEWSATLAEQVG